MVRTFHHRQFDLQAASVSVVIPTRECAATIAPIVETVLGLGVAEQVFVVDADSRDGTARIAREAGATVISENALMPAYGPARGKGDAMWRALSVCTGEYVLYLDGDSGHFGAHFVTGTLGPLLTDPAVQFVKGFYRRPFGDAPEGGGRVTQLTARPLLRRFWPELAALHQPLAGEMAARRDLLASIPFSTGYAVEMAMLLDVYERVGADGIAQVDLDVRRNDHQPLHALTKMSDEVLAAACARLPLPGERPLERPAMSAAAQHDAANPAA